MSPSTNQPGVPVEPSSGITAVLPGALDRTFLLVKEIKGNKAYTEAMGLDLRIMGEKDSAEHSRPEFSLKSQGADGCHCVNIRYKKFGHEAVAVYSKRGTGDFELLGRPSSNPFQDERDLLVPGQPKIRQYELRFYDDNEENGE